MTSPSEGRAQSTQKENHDDSNKDYQNPRKTHIFFGVEDEWSTHSKPPKPHSKGNRRRVIVCSQPYPTRIPNHASVDALMPCVSSLSKLVAAPCAPTELLNLGGQRVNNHRPYPLKE